MLMKQLHVDVCADPTPVYHKSANICSDLLYLCLIFFFITQLYKCKLLQYLCCSILHTVPMAALRVEVEELTSPLITGNMPAGLL